MSTIAPKRVALQETKNKDDAVSTETLSSISSVREMPAWAISLCVHLGVLLVLASITRMTIIQTEALITSEIDDVVQPDEVVFDTAVMDQVGSDSQLNQTGPSQATAELVGQDPKKQMEQELNQEILEIETPVSDTIPIPAQTELISQVVTSGASENPGGVDGAIDRIAFEIEGSLKERKTLVIWLFDASQSLTERRDAIADRFENIYKQLGERQATEDKALKTAVAYFGEGVNIITPEPVDDASTVVDQIRSIPNDESGIENVFTALDTVARKFQKYRTRMRRNIMIVVVTDERGDDFAYMDQVIAFLAKNGMRTYVIGNSAVMGRIKGYHMWTTEDGTTLELPVDQGPETAHPERLKLAFWGLPPQENRELRFLSSGYGPYSLTRLCAETGGLYLISQESRLKFDPMVMKNYVPDYRPLPQYERDVTRNMARRALVQAATKSHADKTPVPTLVFRADTDTNLRRAVTEAQRPFAEFEYHVNQMISILETGKQDRAKLKAPRWRASYDLAMGRALAVRARAYGYNAVLADMKSEPKTFTNKANNAWRIVPSDKIPVSQVRKVAKEAVEYLDRVINEHPGTPWALLAEKERGIPMGWEWKEDYMEIFDPVAMERRRLLLAEEEKKNGGKKKRNKQISKIKL